MTTPIELETVLEQTGMSKEQYDEVTTALFAYWTARAEAKDAQAAKGESDVSERAGVTSGAHLNQIAWMLAEVCTRAGAPDVQVFYSAPAGQKKRELAARGYTLPGWFRPTKQWDLVVGKRVNGSPSAS